MNFWERLRFAIATFSQLGSVDLPTNGRSSKETQNGDLGSMLSGMSTLNPVVDFEVLSALKNLYVFNPDVSQYAANIVNLGNPGHSLSVEASTEAAAEKAVNRLNESASRIYTHGCGVDGLLNQYLASVAWSGAVSSEDVVNFAGRRVEKVVLVPVEQIRFRYNKETDNYDAYQKASGVFASGNDLGLVPLNPETYKYFALSTIENSPYAKPPATAAVEAIVKGQTPILDNIRFMAQKLGLLGFIDFAAQRPAKKPNETPEEYASRCTAYLARLSTALDGNLNKGVMVHMNDQKVTHEPVATGAAGVYDINRLSEEFVMSGMASFPAFHGRTDSTTETFADVVYYILLAQVRNMQRIVKRRMEATYRLDLRLAGIETSGVSLQFDKAHSRNAKAEAETEEIRFRDTFARVKAGMITPDEAAQSLGYDSWADETLLFSESGVIPQQMSRGRSLTTGPNKRTVKLTYDKVSEKYRHQPETIEIWSGSSDSDATASNVVPLKKKALAAFN